MNSQDGIITPHIAHLIARRVIAAANGPFPDFRCVGDRLLAEISTTLKNEIAAYYDQCRHWAADVQMREAIAQLSSISSTRRVPDVLRAPTPELTKDVVAYCAHGPRTLMQLRRRIRLHARLDHKDITEMVRTWECEGVIRNVGSPRRHQWVSTSATSSTSHSAASSLVRPRLVPPLTPANESPIRN